MSYPSILCILGISVSLACAESVSTQRLNGIRFADQFPGTELGAQINQAITDCLANGSPAGCTVYVDQGNYFLKTNMFASVSKPGKLVFLGPGTITTSAQQFVPSGWEIEGPGPGLVFLASGLNPAPPEGMFVNASASVHTATTYHDQGIALHGFTIDGNNLNLSGVTFQGIDRSHLYSFTLRNLNMNGIDLRDGDENLVDENWAGW
jgi:hypothetical protein